MNDDIIKKYENEIILTIYNILYTNDIISGFLHDTWCEFKKSSFYRHDKKMIFNQIEKMRREYERKIHDVLKEKSEYFANSAALFEDYSNINESINVLMFSIKQRLDDSNVKNSVLFARMETARALLDVANQQYEWRMKDLKSIDSGLVRVNLSYLDLSEIGTKMNNLMNSFRFEGNIDMNIPRIQNALNVVVKKFFDFDSIKYSIETAC